MPYSLSTLQKETTDQSDLVGHMREWFAWGMANFAALCLAILVLLALWPQ
jgi:meiotically up-regulated gene 157 (Mug157) protein